MPHSPYQQIVKPVIHDLEEYERDLWQHRCRYDDGESDRDAVDAILDIGADLLSQCKFLEGKLLAKKHEYSMQIRIWKDKCGSVEKELKQLRETTGQGDVDSKVDTTEAPGSRTDGSPPAQVLRKRKHEEAEH